VISRWKFKKYFNFFVGNISDLGIIIPNMADSKKKQTKVYLIPESESRDSHTYHYLAVKTKKLVIENQKLRLKKFNPAKQIHEWFVEAKLPPHSK
jgi:large subunit ribosomal protein L33